MQSASGAFDGSRSWRMGLCAIAVFRTCLDAEREWFEFTVRQLSLVLMQSLMGETPKTAQITLINKFYTFYA
ncbi:hypothetical protein [Moorena producens]|nr:hypothetical protein [Moorena producens]